MLLGYFHEQLPAQAGGVAGHMLCRAVA